MVDGGHNRLVLQLTARINANTQSCTKVNQMSTMCVSCLQDKKRGGIYEAPCYRVKSRKGFNYITSFALRTEDDKSKWILRGAALLCSID
jgi:hypothetical protein